MKIKFNILEEELEELKSISNKEFNEWCNIEGQFELIINNIRFGYVDNDVPFANELIISWLKILNNVALKLKENSNIVVFYIPDSTRWLEIIVDKEILHINEIEPIEKNIDFLITDKKCSNLFRYCNKSEIIDMLKFKGVKFEKGLSEKEIVRITQEYNIEFPEELRNFYMTALPVSRGFYNLRNFDPKNTQYIKAAIYRPINNIYMNWLMKYIGVMNGEMSQVTSIKELK